MPRSLYPDPHWRLIRSIPVRSSIQVSWKSEVCAMKEESDPLFWNTKWSEQVRINRQTTLFWKCTLWSSWPWPNYVYEWIPVLVCLFASVSLGRRRCDVGLFIRTSLVNVISQDAFRVFLDEQSGIWWSKVTSRSSPSRCLEHQRLEGISWNLMLTSAWIQGWTDQNMKAWREFY